MWLSTKSNDDDMQCDLELQNQVRVCGSPVLPPLPAQAGGPPAASAAQSCVVLRFRVQRNIDLPVAAVPSAERALMQLLEAQANPTGLFAGMVESMCYVTPGFHRLREVERRVEHLRISLSSSIEVKLSVSCKEYIADSVVAVFEQLPQFVGFADQRQAEGNPPRYSGGSGRDYTTWCHGIDRTSSCHGLVPAAVFEYCMRSTPR